MKSKSIRQISIICCALAVSLTMYGRKEISWVEKTHDFATFHEDGGRVAVEFKAVNTGDEPVRILSARSTCGCTRPTYNSRPVNPGDTAMIKVAYDPTGRPGRFDKKIYVDFDTDPSRHTLHIKGTAIGNAASLDARYPIKAGIVRLQKDILMMGDMTKGAIKSAYIECYNVSNDTITPMLSFAPSYLHLMTSPAHIAPGEQGVLSATIYSVSVPSYGLLTDTIKIDLRQSENISQTLTIPVTAFINEDFSTLDDKALANAPVSSLSVDKVDLGKIDRSVMQPVTCPVYLTNSGKNTLAIRRIYSPDKGVKVSIDKDKVKKGGKAAITVTIPPETIRDKEIINSSFVLITNDPSVPVRNVRIVGMID